MTPVDINTAARDLYNAIGDSFFSDAQIYNWMWQAEHELAARAYVIESVYTGSTVAAQQSYSYPTNALMIKRVFVNGKKLKRMTDREDQAITLSNSTSTTMGWPIYYTDFASSLSLRPIPDAIYTLQINSYLDASLPSASGTLDVPQIFQFSLVDYILWRMYSKDKMLEDANFHKLEWQNHVKEAIKFSSAKKRKDSFATVQSEDTLPVTILGEA